MRGLLAALLLALPLCARATPEHALRSGEDCARCHVAPSGGGLRTTFGHGWAAAELPTFSAFPQALAPRRPPLVTAGADLRAALDVPAEGPATGNPSHAELSLAARPYNPARTREGRLTLVVTPAWAAASGDPEVREYYALWDDLLLGAWLRAGRLAPVFGPAFGEPSLLTREPFFGAPLDRVRGVAGVEAGLRPGPLHVLASVFEPAAGWDEPPSADGWAGAGQLGLHLGAWRAGLSGAHGADETDLAGHAGLDLDRLWGLPLLYLGEFRARWTEVTGLSAAHGLDWQVVRGLRLKARYEWADPDTDLRWDSHHRTSAGLRWDPLPFVDVETTYTHAWRWDRERFDTARDVLRLALHGGF